MQDTKLPKHYYKLTKKTMEQNNNAQIFKFIGGGILGLIVLVFVLGTFTTVRAGERGIKTRLGKVVSVLEPGLHFKSPFIDSVHKMDVKTRTINYDKNGKEGDAADTSQLFGASKDLQDVQIGVVVNYHIDPSKAGDIYAQYSSVDNYETNVIEPIIRQVVKSKSAEFTAEELVTKRAEYSDQVNATLADLLTSKNAILERFSVTNFEFSKAFSDAIESKVTAVQNAEAQKNKLEQVKYEAQQTVETAKATAEAQRISSAALAAQGGSDYVQLKAIDKWDGHLPEQMIPGTTVPFVNLKN